VVLDWYVDGGENLDGAIILDEGSYCDFVDLIFINSSGLNTAYSDSSVPVMPQVGAINTGNGGAYNRYINLIIKDVTADALGS
jgi:hypothetical protein